MDSLLANYASSDEEEVEDHHQPQPQPKSVNPKTSSFFSSLPQPKSSSLSLTLPQPKPKQPSSLPPNPLILHQDPHQPISNTSSSEPKAKRVVLFKPPIAPSSFKSTEIDDEDDDEEKERRRRKELDSTAAQTPSVKSFLSSIPAPRNSATLGVIPSSGTGRRAIVETDAPASNWGGSRPEDDSGADPNLGNNSVDSNSYASFDSGIDQTVRNYNVNYDTYQNNQSGIDQNAIVDPQSQYVTRGVDNFNYGDDQSYANYGDYGQHESNWTDRPLLEKPGTGEIGVRVPGKRGRIEVPAEIVEVKQDELMKNRPREDQVKLTGIAFGPSYQPVSTKGKPTKLHKRKHQIGSLFFDMKQKEMELSERRSKGFLTKAETQAKYGW
ncbi:proline-rich protein PRCC isoform X1 [Juglans microcarpa x Juglans regia]|uniref:proline-rich protein PRCC isoform X1 n=1 Tax=Juglans microcarpa x Juglans regia TaxID=2249226 RepID=UPI001B7F53FC|nr:proline-rich protein PRCC isoform X1 [Juglans microcarpa x Juglans regia]